MKTSDQLNIISRTKATQTIKNHPTCFSRKTINLVHANFLLKFRASYKLMWPTLIYIVRLTWGEENNHGLWYSNHLVK